MNTSLRRISVMIMALIVLLLANATLTQVFTADGLRSVAAHRRRVSWRARESPENGWTDGG